MTILPFWELSQIQDSHSCILKHLITSPQSPLKKRFQFKTYNTIISLIYVQTFVKVYFFELSGVSNIVPVLTIASLNDNK